VGGVSIQEKYSRNMETTWGGGSSEESVRGPARETPEKRNFEGGKKRARWGGEGRVFDKSPIGEVLIRRAIVG